jgi:hypothetical protein
MSIINNIDIYKTIFKIMTDLAEYTTHVKDDVYAIFHGPFINQLLFSNSYGDMNKNTLIITIIDSNDIDNLYSGKKLRRQYSYPLIKNFVQKCRDQYKLIVNGSHSSEIRSLTYNIEIHPPSSNFVVSLWNKNYTQKLFDNTYQIGKYWFSFVDHNIIDNKSELDIITQYQNSKRIYLDSNYIDTFRPVDEFIEVDKQGFKLKYLWDYTRHSKTLNINLSNIYLAHEQSNKVKYNYPIIKEPSQEEATGIIYQDMNFITNYAKYHPKVDFLFDGSNTSAIKNVLIREMKKIIDSYVTEIPSSEYFYCYRISSYLDPENPLRIVFPMETSSLVGKKIHIPYFYSTYKSFHKANIYWLLNPNMTIMIIRVKYEYKNFVSIDPCKEKTECFFGSEDEILFMPDFDLEIKHSEKIILNTEIKDLDKTLHRRSFYVNCVLVDMIYNPVTQQPTPYVLANPAYPYEQQFGTMILEPTTTTVENKRNMLVYNISYQAMEGVTEGTIQNECPRWKQTDDTFCMRRIAAVIDTLGSSDPFDFVVLVEASSYKKLHGMTSILPNMKQIMTKSEYDVLVLYYNEGYHMTNNVTGEFEGGRPFMLTFFENILLCIISVHAGHYYSIFKLGNLISQLKLSRVEQDILKEGNIIIAGDFNYSFTQEEKIFALEMGFASRILYGTTTSRESNCCINDLGEDLSKMNTKLRTRYDYVLYTEDKVKSEVVTYLELSNDLVKTEVTYSDDYQPDATNVDYDDNSGKYLISNSKYPQYTSDHLPIKAAISLSGNVQTMGTQTGGKFNRKLYDMY